MLMCAFGDIFVLHKETNGTPVLKKYLKSVPSKSENAER
jgi:hypothetical protein